MTRYTEWDTAFLSKGGFSRLWKIAIFSFSLRLVNNLFNLIFYDCIIKTKGTYEYE